MPLAGRAERKLDVLHYLKAVDKVGGVTTIPGDQAFRPEGEGNCPLVKN